MKSDLIQQGLTKDAAVRYLVVEAAQIANIVSNRNQLQGNSVYHSSSAIVASALLASQIKGDERLMIQIKAEQPILSFLCDVNAEGTIRAKFTPNILPPNSDNNIDGYIVTTKYNSYKQLYRGVTEINNMTIENGLQEHLDNSSQIDNYLRIVITCNIDGTVKNATGILLERLPESPLNPSISSKDFFTTYQCFKELKESQLISDIKQKKLCGFDLFPLESKPLRWECKCSQEKIENMLCSLGAKEIRSLIEEQNGASITCDFCNTKYHCSAEKLQILINILEESGN
jgi:molecular chaperone Hsp33